MQENKMKRNLILDTIKEMTAVGLSNSFIIKEISVMFNITKAESEAALKKMDQ